MGDRSCHSGVRAGAQWCRFGPCRYPSTRIHVTRLRNALWWKTGLAIWGGAVSLWGGSSCGDGLHRCLGRFNGVLWFVNGKYPVVNRLYPIIAI